jgi:hypothetical protein
MRGKDFYQFRGSQIRSSIRFVSDNRELLSLNRARQARDKYKESKDKSPMFHNGVILALP